VYQRFSLVRSTGKKRLKRSEPLLLEFWIVILSLFVLFFQCGHSWAFWRAAKHDPTRVVSTTKQTNVFLFSPTQKIDHVPWPTARAQLCETTEMLRASLQLRTQMIVAPCVHQTPMQAQACQLQAPQASSRIPKVLGRFGAQMSPGSTIRFRRFLF